VECGLRFESNLANQGQLQMNKALAEQLIEGATWVMEKAGHGSMNPVDILRWPGVMEAQAQDMDALSSALIGCLDTGHRRLPRRPRQRRRQAESADRAAA
jgi:uncharacterized protein (TIGR00255 family)